MEKEQFLQLLKKYRTGQATEQEKNYLSAYYNLFEAEPDVTEMLSAGETDFLKNQIKAGIKSKIELHQKSPVVKTFIIYRRLAIAAIVLIMFSATALIYSNVYRSNLFAVFSHPHDIAPGGDKAILTLANGKQIILTNAKNGLLAQQGGTQINKTASGQIIYNVSGIKPADTTYNTISTPRGGQFVVILPDSSKVYLDAASSLRFPTAFTGKLRAVMLTGEAYFEVAHNKNKPFHVITKGQTVEVLGTHFNINAYDDEKAVKTTLLEGSVRVSAAGSTALLIPGQQSQMTPGNVITVIPNANTDEAVAWKNGFFQFENADLQTIMRQFSRWYNLDVQYDGKVGERLFSGEIHRNLTVLQALDLLNYADVHFNVEGKKIIVSP